MGRSCLSVVAVIWALSLGFAAAAEPPAEAPPGCQGDGCRGSGSVPVPVPGAGTASFEAPGPLGLFGAAKVRGPKATLRAMVPAAGRLTVSGGGLATVVTTTTESSTVPLALVLTPAARRRLQRRKVIHSQVEALFVSATGEPSRAELTLRFESPGRGGRR